VDGALRVRAIISMPSQRTHLCFSFLNDTSDEIREQAYHILRNVAENEEGISLIFRELCPLPPLHSSPFPVSDRNLLDVIAELLSSPSSPNNVVVQATYVIANMANGHPKDTMEIVKHGAFLEALRTVIAERGSDVRRPAVSCILNLVQERDQVKERRRTLVRAGVADTLRRVCEWAPITSAVSGSRPMARRMSHGTVSGGGVGVPTVGGYLHPSDRTGVSVSPTQTRGPLSHQRSLTATFPVSSVANTGVAPGIAFPTGASAFYNAHRTGTAAAHSTVAMPVSTTYRGSSYIPGWLPEHGLRADGSTLMPYLDERGSGSSAGGSNRAGISPTGATYGNWGPQWHSGGAIPPLPSPAPGLSGGVAVGGATGGAVGVALGPISPAPSGGQAPVHPAMDIDKEVYERAKRALDFLEHGDSYAL
jgi:armadillo repeat-containing protein 8